MDFKEDDGEPFYVGKGTESRIKDLNRNNLHTKIKNKHGILRKILFETHSEQDAFQKEIELIQELKTHIDFGEGGANFTLGGEGCLGSKRNEEQRENTSKSLKKKWEDHEYRQKNIESKKKKWEDPEFKLKVIESQKKKWEDPEYRQKMSEIFKKPETIEKKRESTKRTWEDPQHKEKISDVMKQHHNDPEFRKKQGEKMREVLSDPEIREKISRNTKEKLSDPEIRKKMSENTKLGISKITPEQRSERTKKGWETRRLQKLRQEN